MLVRNPQTGALHEVPDQPTYGMGEPVYDGFGNPVGGIFDFLNPVKMVSNLVGSLMPGGGGGAPPLPPLPPIPQLPFPGGLFQPGSAVPAPGFAPPAFPSFMNQHLPFHRYRHPVGWVTPALPFTGTAPRRMYLRCATWPGEAGLVPQWANQPAAAAAGGFPGGGFHHRRHRRRR